MHFVRLLHVLKAKKQDCRDVTVTAVNNEARPSSAQQNTAAFTSQPAALSFH